MIRNIPYVPRPSSGTNLIFQTSWGIGPQLHQLFVQLLQDSVYQQKVGPTSAGPQTLNRGVLAELCNLLGFFAEVVQELAMRDTPRYEYVEDEGCTCGPCTWGIPSFLSSLT